MSESFNAINSNICPMHDLFNSLHQSSKRTIAIVNINYVDKLTYISIVEPDSYEYDTINHILHITSSRTYKVPGMIAKTILSRFEYDIPKLLNCIHHESVTTCDSKYIGEYMLSKFDAYCLIDFDVAHYVCLFKAWRSDISVPDTCEIDMELYFEWLYNKHIEKAPKSDDPFVHCGLRWRQFQYEWGDGVKSYCKYCDRT